MRYVYLILLKIVACTSAFITSPQNYHETVGIPEAARIKAAEDQIFSQRKVQGHVADVTTTLLNSHPYLAGLLIRFWNSGDEAVCGASVLSVNRLVTAAHCWSDGTYLGLELTAVLGTPYLCYGGFRILTAMVTMHPRWNPEISTGANNVAMITLPVNLTFRANIQPIRLPSRDQMSKTYVFQWLVAVGYGKTSDQESSKTTSAEVKQMLLQVIPVHQCQESYGPHQVNLLAICTSAAGGKGLCKGDFGGPLVVNLDGHDVLIGIGSIGSSRGCQLGWPSVFTNVSSVLPFITENL